VQNNTSLIDTSDPHSADLDVISRGPVRQMRIPHGWSWGERRNSGSQLNSYQELFLRNNPEVTIWFFYRGSRISEASTKLFHEILAKHDHLLSKTEITSLSDVLKEQADPQSFDLLIAKAAEINGRKVLVVEGRYRETHLDRYHLYLEADLHGQGGVIQEIFYQAPKENYFRHLAEAKNAFNTIQWNNA
jgi:hypothetical protein